MFVSLPSLLSCKKEEKTGKINQQAEDKEQQNEGIEVSGADLSAVVNILSKKFMLVLSTSSIITASALLREDNKCMEKKVEDSVLRASMKNCDLSPFVFSGNVTSYGNRDFFKSVSIYIQDGPVILENGEFDIEITPNKIAIYSSRFELIPFSSDVASKYVVSMNNAILSMTQEEDGLTGINLILGKKSYISFEEKVLGEKLEIKAGNGSFSVLFGQKIFVSIEGEFVLSGCAQFSGEISGEKLEVSIDGFFATGYICPISGSMIVKNGKWKFENGSIIVGSNERKCEDIKICL